MDRSEASSGGLNTDSVTDSHDPAMYAGKCSSDDEKLLLLTYTWKAPTTFKSL